MAEAKSGDYVEWVYDDRVDAQYAMPTLVLPSRFSEDISLILSGPVVVCKSELDKQFRNLADKYNQAQINRNLQYE